MKTWTWIGGLTAGLVVACSSSETRRDRSGQDAAPCADRQLPALLQAEDAALEGVEVETGGGVSYVSGFAELGDRLTFRVCAPEDGYYTLSFRHAQGDPGVATRTIVVDGTPFPAQLRFPPLWDWSLWGEDVQRALHLEPGEHEIAVEFRASDRNALRLDSMTFAAGPVHSEKSVTSLLMNDWDDLVVGWHAAQLHPDDDSEYGPRLTALHVKQDWPTNQIDEAQAFFRDDTSGVSFSDPHAFETRSAFTASDEDGYGELHTRYVTYDGSATSVDILRRQIVPPEDDVVLVRYALTNVTSGERRISLLEWADLHNRTGGPSEDPADSGSAQTPTGTLRAEWRADVNAWIVDMTETNGIWLVVGAFEAPDHHVAGATAQGASDKDADLVKQFFADPSALVDVSTYSDAVVGVGMSATVDIPAGETRELSFYYSVMDSEEAAGEVAQRMSGADPETISRAASERWSDWLDSGKVSSLETDVPAWRDAAQVAMITIRQSQQPEFGSFVAATNPAYFYSVWPRDASVTAIGLDAAGYPDEAERYWRWMAQAQADGSNPDFPDGTWWTNYGYWSEARGITFVSPEWDSLGLFLAGVWHHHRLLEESDPARAQQFLDDLWQPIEDSANFIQAGSTDAGNHGFGPADYSIWEEELAYHTFTQVTYVAGLRAASLLAEERGGDTHGWTDAASSIREAIFRDVSATPCPGLWDAEGSYFIRAVNPDCTANEILDASTDLLWVLGVLSPEDPRAGQHREAVLANLTPSEDFGFGISRYEGDTFYYSARFSPGGAYEATAPMPTWPQMAMYMAMLEHWQGLEQISANRLSWVVATQPWGFQPQGEAVDWATQRPLISTASEPVTGAWFVLGLLTKLGQFDMRVDRAPDW